MLCSRFKLEKKSGSRAVDLEEYYSDSLKVCQVTFARGALNGMEKMRSFYRSFMASVSTTAMCLSSLLTANQNNKKKRIYSHRRKGKELGIVD